MISANELRIGNKIAYSSHILTVQELRKNNYVCVSEGIDGYLDEYDGIPLTPEILEQCGFIQGTGDSKHIYYLKTFSLRKSRDYQDKWILLGGFAIADATVYIEYLHQLQNLYFALTGEELQIKQAATV